MFETLKVMTNLCSQLNSKETYQPQGKSRRESHAGICVEVFGVGTFCGQFSRKPLLYSRDTERYRQRKRKSRRVQACVRIYTSSFLKNSSEPLRAVRGPNGVEMGQAEAGQRTSSTRMGRRQGLHVRQPLKGWSFMEEHLRQHRHRMHCQQGWRKS